MHRWLMLGAFSAALVIAGCGPKASAQEVSAAKAEPSRLEPIEGTDLSRVILTEEAADRLDVHTEAVSETEVEGQPHISIPYAAVIYDVEGEAWVYTSPEPLTFVRHAIDIDTIEGDQAILAEGPPVGTPVVTVGASELYGAEFEFQEG